jgi:hypothetical protein
MSIQCLPLYSILLAMGNPTVNYFRQFDRLSCQHMSFGFQFLEVRVA